MEELENLFVEKRMQIEIINEGRKNIAKLKMDKAKMKAPLWEEAQGTVDAKKDFIRSKTAEIDRDIAHEEANIEYCYNMIDLINDRMNADE